MPMGELADENEQLKATINALHDRYGLHEEEKWALLPEGVEVADHLIALTERAESAESQLATLRAVINRIAAQVGHPPIAAGEVGLESVAECDRLLSAQLRANRSAMHYLWRLKITW
jgi:hypothetical protein